MIKSRVRKSRVKSRKVVKKSNKRSNKKLVTKSRRVVKKSNRRSRVKISRKVVKKSNKRSRKYRVGDPKNVRKYLEKEAYEVWLKQYIDVGIPLAISNNKLPKYIVGPNQKNYFYECFLKNPIAPFKYIESYKINDSYVDSSYIDKNLSVPFDFIKENYLKKRIDYIKENNLEIPSDISVYTLSSQRRLDPSWRDISENVSWDIVLKNIQPEYSSKHIPWNWEYLSKNPNITWDIVKSSLVNPEKYKIGDEYIKDKWNWESLSSNPNINWNIVKSNPEYPWNWRGLSANPSITWDIIVQNEENPWDYYEIIKRVNFDNIIRELNLEFLEENADILSENPTITIRDIKNYPEWNWDWYSLSKNLSWDDIKNNTEYPWDWNVISKENNNLSWDIISRNLDKKWDWCNLLKNPMKKGREQFIKQYVNNKLPLSMEKYKKLIPRKLPDDISELILKKF